MRCVAEAGLRIEPFAALEALPPAARALFGADAFSTLAWYRAVTESACAAGTKPCFQVVWRGEAVLAVLPMWRSADGFSAMTTPYTVRWAPLLAPDLDPATLVAVGRALGRCWRGWPATRLDAVDGDASWLPPLLRGATGAGLMPLRFAHFGNWHLDVTGLGWDAYLAARPGALRSAIARRTKRLMQGMGARFALVAEPKDVRAGIAAYAQVYARSWKEPEPYPDFMPALIRTAADSGTLRLGILFLAETPIAVQFWLVHASGHGMWAGVQKLAHDEAHRQLAPGTVLTALVLRQLFAADGVTELDFGRGDDEYKRLWTGDRRQREGVVLASAWRWAGAIAIARHHAGSARKAWRHRIRPPGHI